MCERFLVLKEQKIIRTYQYCDYTDQAEINIIFNFQNSCGD